MKLEKYRRITKSINYCDVLHPESEVKPTGMVCQSKAKQLMQ
jgi:hypothetical protein